MFDVCPRCGMWSVEREVREADDDDSGQWAIAVCPACGDQVRFRRLPLFMIVGASGSGKSTLCLSLVHRLPDHVVLESDVLWGMVGADADGGYAPYHNVWLRMVKNIHQAGRSVVLCGIAQPDQIETLPERRYIGSIHFLVLVCDDEILAARLRARPAWRQSADEAFVQQAVRHNRWYAALAVEGRDDVTFLDTGALGAKGVGDAARAWVLARS